MAMVIENVLEDKNYIFWWIVSIFFDLYHLNFVGMSFAYLSLTMIVLDEIKKSRKYFSSLSLWYYLLFVLIIVEIFMYFITVCFDGNYNIMEHALVLLKTMFIYGVIEVLKRIQNVAK